MLSAHKVDYYQCVDAYVRLANYRRAAGQCFDSGNGITTTGNYSLLFYCISSQKHEDGNVLDRELFLDDVTYRVFANGKSGLGSGSQVSDFSVRLPRSFLFLLVRPLAYPFSSKLRTIKPKNPEWRCFFFLNREEVGE